LGEAEFDGDKGGMILALADIDPVGWWGNLAAETKAHWYS